MPFYACGLLRGLPTGGPPKQPEGLFSARPGKTARPKIPNRIRPERTSITQTEPEKPPRPGGLGKGAPWRPQLKGGAANPNVGPPISSNPSKTPSRFFILILIINFIKAQSDLHLN
ncbi:uncharacterized protein PGTG_08196 [Puccinia graminis f. sp. tritici CRL 75-36-700-3]|uniref:Uncharacterized protein n=1 Tax=Puccinia graminis f. sp. tritici (strain CRL 75-36-700-3 / race SCCL) TaxID=418459 RepID=E3KCJ9_PUCGT|nr:uncharacterized protein PGTG_08196 [Puccinia graminis f. sp. tritici CRL 75-36-700-3]EFP81947.2 hypothetical protein PGTG_08196 [Puccinia graminis f. sp. tritici CRL 75-36-700-3]